MKSYKNNQNIFLSFTVADWMFNWVFTPYIFYVHKYCIWRFTVVYVVGQMYFHNIKFTGNIHSYLCRDSVFDISFLNSSKMVLPVKYREHYCASCRICSSVVLVTLCFYPDKLVLTLKFIKKKPLCCFLLLVFYNSWQKKMNRASHVIRAVAILM